jgi:hypothetical protein
MRPGAAVRLKGTWVDESKKQSGIDVTSQASSEGETSTGSEQPELKVSEVEVLGGSDPMVCLSRASEYLGLGLFSHISRHTRSRTNIRPLKVFALSHICGQERL